MKFTVNLKKKYYKDFREAYLELQYDDKVDPADELSEYMYDVDCAEAGAVFQDMIHDIAEEIIKKVDKENKK